MTTKVVGNVVFIMQLIIMIIHNIVTTTIRNKEIGNYVAVSLVLNPVFLKLFI